MTLQQTNMTSEFPQLSNVLKQYLEQVEAERKEDEARTAEQVEKAKAEIIERLQIEGVWQDLEFYTTFDLSNFDSKKLALEAEVKLPNLWPFVVGNKGTCRLEGERYALPLSELAAVLIKCRDKWAKMSASAADNLASLKVEYNTDFDYHAKRVEETLRIYAPELLPELEKKRQVNKEWKAARARRARKDQAWSDAKAQLKKDRQARFEQQCYEIETLRREAAEFNRSLVEQMQAEIPDQEWWRITYAVGKSEGEEAIVKQVYAVDRQRLGDKEAFTFFDPQEKKLIEAEFPTVIEIARIALPLQLVGDYAPSRDFPPYTRTRLYYPPQWGKMGSAIFISRYPEFKELPDYPVEDEFEPIPIEDIDELAAEIWAELEAEAAAEEGEA